MRRQSITALALFFLLSGCVTLAKKHDVTVTIHSLESNPERFSHKKVVVSGYLKVDELGNMMLFSNKNRVDLESVDEGIDIVQKKHLINFPKMSGCALVEGIFVPYEVGSAQLDFLRSKIGLIDATQYRSARCSE